MIFAPGACALKFADFETGTCGWERVDAGPALETAKRFASSGTHSLALPVNGAQEATIRISGTFDWTSFDTLIFHAALPAQAKTWMSFVCYFKDRDWNWFQSPLITLKPGDRKEIALDISASSFIWQPMSGPVGWDGYLKRNIREFGIKCYFSSSYSGHVYFDDFQLCETGPADSIILTNFEINSATVERYRKFEASFTIPVVFSNPFDPEEIDIEGVFISPSGRELCVPAFFTRDYLRLLDTDGEVLYPYGRSMWKVRFSPEETGRYTFRVRAAWKGRNYLFDCGTFQCVQGASQGFVRWDKSDPGCLSFDSGKFFYPIGYVIRSPDDIRQPYPYEFTPDKGLGTFAYDSYFPKMTANGENYTRVWMGAWWTGIEWSPAYASHYEGLGRYSLENSWKLDRILETAEKNNIYIVLTLINHGQFSVRPDAEWWDNPYNVANGGFLSSPDEFFTDPLAQKYLMRKLRYVVSRWGYSTSIAFWELWNEVDLTGYYDTAKVRSWHERVIPLLRSIDPWKHLITTHICRQEADPLVWAISGLETIVGNSYSPAVVNLLKDYYLKRLPFGKPIMVHEFGVGRNKETLEANLHAGIWASSVMPMLGTALFWWWPFIDKQDLYFHYSALAKYLDGLDRRGKDFQLSDAIAESTAVDTGVRIGCVGMQNKSSAYLWVFDAAVYSERPPLRNPGIIRGARVRVKHLSDGFYSVQFWDTLKGVMIASGSFQASGDETIVTLPEFVKDIAIKIERNS
jgi:hypothetical protein